MAAAISFTTDSCPSHYLLNIWPYRSLNCETDYYVDHFKKCAYFSFIPQFRFCETERVCRITYFLQSLWIICFVCYPNEALSESDKRFSSVFFSKSLQASLSFPSISLFSEKVVLKSRLWWDWKNSMWCKCLLMVLALTELSNKVLCTKIWAHVLESTSPCSLLPFYASGLPLKMTLKD